MALMMVHNWNVCTTDCEFAKALKATTNCTQCVIYRIDASGVIKVADFGLAEDVYSANYYHWKKGDTKMKFTV